MSLINKLDFEEFPVTSSAKWKAQIAEELKKKSEEEIKWESENLILKPFYTTEDTAVLKYLEKFHSQFIVKSPRHWYTRENIQAEDPYKANKAAIKALESGADAITFILNNSDYNNADIAALIHKISPGFSPVSFKAKFNPEKLAGHLLECKLNNAKGSFYYLPLSHWMREYTDTDFKKLSYSLAQFADIPKYKILGIDSAYFHENKSGAIKEIAYTISLALEYFDNLTEAGSLPQDVLRHFEFSLYIGEKFFREIAKVRAFRLVWYQLAKLCDNNFDPFTTPVHCTTSLNTFSATEPHHNILRNTISAMASVTGGCDSLSVLPFDITEKKETDFASRISRNISLILREESYFNQVVDPAGGSYYIETLTHQMAEQAWNIIKEIENKGGFSKAFEKGLIK
ncbi:MAG: hypothetical protein K2X86_04515 [Cytophagaceae bacterium]|nr:hypothetical protein [Cytophagaceae bacterium]